MTASNAAKATDVCATQHPQVAAIVALVAAAGIMVRSLTTGGLKLLELGAVIAFLGWSRVSSGPPPRSTRRTVA